MKYEVWLEVKYAVTATDKKELEKIIAELKKTLPKGYGINLSKAERKKVQFLQWEEK